MGEPPARDRRRAGPGRRQADASRRAAVSLGPGRAVGDAQVKATVDVEGRDVRAVVGTLVPAPAVSGPIKGRVQVTGTGARLTATGAVTFDRLTLTDAPPHCPDPKPRTLVLDEVKVPLLYAPPQLESQQVQTKVAKGTVTFRLLVALGPTARRQPAGHPGEGRAARAGPGRLPLPAQCGDRAARPDRRGEPAAAGGHADPRRVGPAPIGAGRVVGPRPAQAREPGPRPDRPVGSALTPGGRGGSGAQVPAQLRLDHRHLYHHQRRGPHRRSASTPRATCA